MEKLMGINSNVFKSAGIDCSANGLTSKYDSLLVVDPSIIDSPFNTVDDPAEDYLIFVKRMIGGSEYVHAIPSKLKGKVSMFGGNFVYSSDSRFPATYPIPVHDRVETQRD